MQGGYNPYQSFRNLENKLQAIAKTPAPPYYAVIFSSIRTDGDNGYYEAANRMVELASIQPGFLGFESVRWSSASLFRTGPASKHATHPRKSAASRLRCE